MGKNEKSFKTGHKVNQKYVYSENLTPQKAFYIRNKHKLLEKARLKLQNKRIEVLNHYGGTPPKCTCCGETHIEFLAFDHINGGGGQHRRSLNKNGHRGGNIYTWLKKNNYPEGFQVLCHNCNSAKSYYGGCPHKRNI